jgi:drug/metabolite transporter (DMT)-like permease
MRFAIACGALTLFGVWRRQWLPARGTRVRVAFTGLLLIGSYSSCFFLALEQGITPGVLATVMGVQPVLTLVLMERRFPLARIAGLVLALCGLFLVVWQSFGLARFSVTGMLFALGGLASMTTGAILQKQLTQAPAEVLPLQYAMSLALCLLIVPFQPFALEYSLDLLIPLLWLSLVISVVAQLLLYRLIRAGNLVNVTSLFYLVPAVTAAMDYVFLGNPLSPATLCGMAAIMAGLLLVFRTASSPQVNVSTAATRTDSA